MSDDGSQHDTPGSTHGLIVDARDHVLYLTLSRPQKKNAFTDAMYAAFADAMERLAAENDLHCLVIRAEGNVFSAGNDLNGFLVQNESGLGAPVVRLLHLLAAADKPLVAEVDGPAVGIGTTLLLHCDFVTASAAASFHTPFAQLGLVPEAGSSLLFPALLGYRRAMEMFLLGTPLDARQALEHGLVNRIVEPADLEAATRVVTDQLLGLPIEAVKATKRLCRSASGTLAQVIDRELAEFSTRLQSPETRIAIERVLNRQR